MGMTYRLDPGWSCKGGLGSSGGSGGGTSSAWRAKRIVMPDGTHRQENLNANANLKTNLAVNKIQRTWLPKQLASGAKEG